MLIKEYRIPLPLTVEEYRIAQLYMIAKKSREESKGVGSGVEILVNEPYQGGPGGKGGQYTRKVYHIGSHLPGWIKSLIPKSALTVEEEAWNAYPYTKTRYTSLFIEKFFIEIETYYYADNGFQENVFGLTGSDLRSRTVDIIDVVKDQVYGAEYVKEEDPKLYKSEKTGRGPLGDNWLEEYWAECKGKTMPTPEGKAIMCAYKLCRVEFRYWGVQSKLEKFIDDVALRKTMHRAHRQAWVWQDEWFGLSMEDIREIERETQEALKEKMGAEDGVEDAESPNGVSCTSSSVKTPETASVEKTIASALVSIEKKLDSPKASQKGESSSSSSKSIGKTESGNYSLDLNVSRIQQDVSPQSRKKWSRSNSRAALHSPTGSGRGLDMTIDKWRIESLRRDSESDSDDEFFDCQEDMNKSDELVKWSSVDFLPEDDNDEPSPTAALGAQDSIFSHAFLQRMASEKGKTQLTRLNQELSCPGSPTTHSSCNTSILILVVHGGSVLDPGVDLTAKKSDVTTFRGAFESVMRQHYPSVVGHITVKLVACSSICTEGLGILSSLSPYSFNVSPSSNEMPQVTNDSIPVGAIPLFATSSAEYQEAVTKAISSCNAVYQEFIRSEEGRGFSGQVVLIGDSIGSIIAYDALARSSQSSSRHDSENSILEAEIVIHDFMEHPGKIYETTVPSNESNVSKLEFEVSDFFLFGSPLPIVLAHRKILNDDKSTPIPRPGASQVYNLFHPTDPGAARLEPLISARFSMIPPLNVARYQKYPLGDGQPCQLLEMMQSHPQLFAEVLGSHSNPQFRRMSEISMQSGMSGSAEPFPLQNITAITQRWWGTKRLDYALYCPEGLSNFPTNSLPHLFHASYWESFDVIAFILRQISRSEFPIMSSVDKTMSRFSPSQPREKWLKKRTSVKLKNMAANHRANDVIVCEGAPQALNARFVYGPLDMITLTGEKVDIHIMREYPGGEWTHLGTEITDKTGRINYTLPRDKTLSYGVYPVKMIVRGDHTSVDFYLVVVPPNTECVVFSIDGALTASMSVTGRDPKIKPGAVDVVRYWQELGYCILYITARPDMQQQGVMSWLSQHNFPHGYIYFADGLSRFPLIHKTEYLKSLTHDHGMIIHAAYGSPKDIAVYSTVGLQPSQIYIVGTASKKLQAQATILSDGYAAHLAHLMSHGGSRPAQGNARMVIPRGFFGLPGQNASLRWRRLFQLSFICQFTEPLASFLLSGAKKPSQPNFHSFPVLISGHSLDERTRGRKVLSFKTRGTPFLVHEEESSPSIEGPIDFPGVDLPSAGVQPKGAEEQVHKRIYEFIEDLENNEEL